MIAKAKMEILEGMNRNSAILIPYGEVLLAESKGETVSIMDTNADYCLLPTESSNGGTSFVFKTRGNDFFRSKAPAIGHGNLRALSFSIACAIKSGLEAESIENGISKISANNFRQRYVNWGGRLIVDDSYNASLESVESLLELIRYFPGRRCAVLGDIHELGSQAELIHFKIGAEAARLGITKLFLHGIYAPSIKKGAVASGMPENAVFLNEDPSDIQSIVTAIRTQTCAGDVLVFKASNTCHFSDLINELISREDS